MADGQYLKLITEQRGPAHSRLERTLREAQGLSKALAELSLALTGSRQQDAAPKGIAARSPDGLLPQIDATARDIEAEIAGMKALIDHIRKQI